MPKLITPKKIQIDSAFGLEDLGTLKKFEIKIPSFEKLDKELSVHVSNGVNGNEEVFSVRKQLIEKDLIKQIKNRARRFRLDIEEWMMPQENGWHFVLNGHAPLVEKEYDAFKSNMIDCFINPFVSQYETLIEQQSIELGNAFDRGDYPALDTLVDRPLTAEERNRIHEIKNVFFPTDSTPWLKGHFHINDHVAPVPSIDLERTVFAEDVSSYGRKDNPTYDQLFAKITHQQQQRNSEFKNRITSETIDALSSSLDATANTLAKYDKDNKKSSPFRDTLVNNLSKTISISEDKNKSLFNSDQLATAIDIAKDALKGITTQSLREDDTLRKDVAKKLSKSKSLLGV